MAFNVISIINLDMARPNADIVNAVQYDNTGSSAPSSSVESDGDLYFKTTYR